MTNDMDRAGAVERAAFTAYMRKRHAYEYVHWNGADQPSAKRPSTPYGEGWVPVDEQWAAWLARAALSREPREEGVRVIEAAKEWRVACWNRPLTRENIDRDNCAQHDLREAVDALITSDRRGNDTGNQAHPPAPAGGARAEPYVPKCGDVFGWEWETDAEAEAEYVRVAVGGDRWVGVSDGGISHGMRDEPVGKGARYLRPATPAERAAAGFHDAGGVGEEKAREVDLLVRVEEFLRAAYVTPGARYVRDIAGVSSLLVMLKHARNGGDDPRRGESGEAIKAQGGAL